MASSESVSMRPLSRCELSATLGGYDRVHGYDVGDLASNAVQGGTGFGIMGGALWGFLRLRGADLRWGRWTAATAATGAVLAGLDNLRGQAWEARNLKTY
jgi:hypothetical protein